MSTHNPGDLVEIGSIVYGTRTLYIAGDPEHPTLLGGQLIPDPFNGRRDDEAALVGKYAHGGTNHGPSRDCVLCRRILGLHQ